MPLLNNRPQDRAAVMKVLPYTTLLNLVMDSHEVTKKLTMSRAQEEPHCCQKHGALALLLAFPCINAIPQTKDANPEE